VTGHYASDGYGILTYKKGNRGVRFIFAKTGGDADAPGFIQFVNRHPNGPPGRRPKVTPLARG
jgi:Zn/Cd-binding protein ZinT